MKHLQHTLDNIKPLNNEFAHQMQQQVDALSKPVGSLGKLEKLAVQLATICESEQPSFANKAVIVCAGDHGVYDEGITSNPQSVTLLQTLNFPQGKTGVCAIAAISNAKVITVDVGIKGEIPPNNGILLRKVKNGTDNMAIGPAMSRQEAIQAIEVGIEVANNEIQNGIQILATGEMGIGNTTPSSAILAVLQQCDPQEVTGFGAGVGEGGLVHKIQVIRQAIALNQPNPNDAIDVLAKVGGLEIGAMTGIILAAAANRKPVVIDGFISTIAALLAYKLAPSVKSYIIASHASEEPGAKVAAKLLGIEPMLYMNMRLGEGSGAALAFPIIDAACSMLKNMNTLDELMELMS